MSDDFKRVKFNYLLPLPALKERKALKSFIVDIVKAEGKTVGTINYIFCTDAYLLTINKQFLNHDTYTDIITFELNNPGEALLSDIYISAERVKENAINWGIPYSIELLRVIFHGVLHLCGYRDKKQNEKKLIRAKEDFYINKFVSRETKNHI